MAAVAAVAHTITVQILLVAQVVQAAVAQVVMQI
jgi:hypothetical protein